MPSRYRKGLLAFATAFALLFHANIARLGADNPHLVTQGQARNTCSQCHVREPNVDEPGLLNTKNHTAEPTAFKIDGVAMCTACHNPNQGHTTGLSIDFPVPADMPLNDENEMICRTCHYMHGSLSSDSPQASSSFIDRLLNPERLHKSYILRRNNSDGELCLICHAPKPASKP